MRNFRTIMISGANASRDDAERAATLFVVLQGSALSADETIGLINKGRRS